MKKVPFLLWFGETSMKKSVVDNPEKSGEEI